MEAPSVRYPVTAPDALHSSVVVGGTSGTNGLAAGCSDIGHDSAGGSLCGSPTRQAGDPGVQQHQQQRATTNIDGIVKKVSS